MDPPNSAKCQPRSSQHTHTHKHAPAATVTNNQQLYDTWFYFSHRYCHVNKWLFRHVHGKHHRSEAYLDITSSSFEHPVDGIFAVGIPTGLMMLWGLHTRQFWPAVVMIHTTACVIAFGEGAPPPTRRCRRVAPAPLLPVCSFFTRHFLVALVKRSLAHLP